MLYAEKRTKEGEAFQTLSDKNSKLIAEWQLQLKSLVMEAGELNLAEKMKLAIIPYVKSVHNISEGSLTYDDRKISTPIIVR